MKDYIVMTESTSDLPKEYLQRSDLEVLPMEFTIGGETYLNYLDERTYKIHDFYEAMKSGELTKTNQVTPTAWMNAFEAAYKKGLDVLVVAFSSGLSGTYNSACLAAETFKEEHKDANIFVIDSKCASAGEGLLVYYALKAKEKGLTLEENYEYTKALQPKISHWFTVDDIETLRRGGRLSNGAAFIAKTLKIKPVLYVDPDGHLIARMKKIGRKSALNALVEKFVEMYIPEENDIIFISHGDRIEDAEYVANEIKKQTGVSNFSFSYIGPVIGSHSGPGTIALFFVSKER